MYSNKLLDDGFRLHTHRHNLYYRRDVKSASVPYSLWMDALKSGRRIAIIDAIRNILIETCAIIGYNVCTYFIHLRRRL